MTLDPSLSFAVQGVTRRFPGVLAVDDVDLGVRKGEIHGLIGKNGAGKSVLVSLVAGLLSPTEGQVVTEYGALTPTYSGPSRAKKLGIALVTQEPAFAADLSVVDNLFMGRHTSGRFNFLSPSAARRESANVIEQLGLRARPENRMGDLPLETQQLLAFGRAVFIEKARTILLDEITASLTSERKESLLGLLRRLIDDTPDLSFVLISHHVSEVMGFTDRVSVLRDGKLVATLETGRTSGPELADWIVGDVVPAEINYSAQPESNSPPVLNVSGLAAGRNLRRLDLQLRRGEVLGFAGLEGSGKDDAIEALYGLEPSSSGSVLMDGEEVHLKGPKAAQAAGVSFLPKHREEQAVIQNRSVLENAIIAGLPALTNRFGFVRRSECERVAQSIVNRLEIKTPGLDVPIDGLSGGNKQKVLLGRLSLSAPRVVLLNEPTRGVDISAKPHILKLVREDLSRDAGVIMISESEEELAEICDRILIFYQGEVVRELKRGMPGFDVETIYKSIQGVEVPV
mgnify:FL=1